MKLPSIRRKIGGETRAAKPPRRANKSKRNWLVFGGLFLAFVGWRVYRARTAPKPHDTVETAIVKAANVREMVSASGTIQPFTTVDVKSKAGGKVLQMAVEEGTRVKQGQLICIIDRQDTTTQLNQAQADLDAARSALRQAQENVRLQRASVGPQIAGSAAGVSSAQARLQQARQTLAVEAGANPAQIAQSAAGVKAARANLQQSKLALDLQKRTSVAAINEAQSGVKAAQARLDQTQATAKNQPQLSNSNIAGAQAAANAASASVNSAQEALTLLQTATQPQETAATRAGVSEAQSALTTAQTSLSRQEALLVKGYVAQNTVDDARNAVVSARSNLQTAQARLDTLEAAQNAAVGDSRARLAQAKSSLAQSQAALQSARLGSVQNTISDKDVISARAALEQAQSQLTTARANQKQIAVRQSEVAASAAALQQAQSSLTAISANKGNINVRAADVAAARAALEQADATLNGSRANTIQTSVRQEDVAQARARLVRAQTTVEDAKTQLAQTRVTAPRDGVILQKYVDEGSIIQSGQLGAQGGTSIVQLANVSRLYVDVKVDEADIAKVAAGQKVVVTLDAYPDQPRRGTVRKIYPLAIAEANVTYVRVQVEIDPAQINSKLRPSMNTTCDFVVADQKDALSVPPEAVRDKGKDSVVTVIKDPKKPAWEKSNQVERKVKVGVLGDERTQVKSGLKAGETVVTKVTEPDSGKPSPFGGGGDDGE